MTGKLMCCGRGHASEKPELPAALAETASSIRFLGPPAPAMAALGDKARLPDGNDHDSTCIVGLSCAVNVGTQNGLSKIPRLLMSVRRCRFRISEYSFLTRHACSAD